MIIKMLNTLGRRMDEHRNNFSKELEHIKKNQTEVKNTINEKKKSTLEGITNRLDYTQEWIHKLEDNVVENTQAEQKIEIIIIMYVYENSESQQASSIHIIGIPKGGVRQKRVRELTWRQNSWKPPWKLGKEAVIQVQEGKKFPNMLNAQRSTQRCNLKGRIKYKGRLLKAVREKQHLYTMEIS